MHFLPSAEFSASLPCVVWSPDVIASLLCRWLPSASACRNKIFGFITIKYLFFALISFCIFPCQKLPAILQYVHKVRCKQEEIMYIEQFVTPCSESGKSLRLGGKNNVGLGSIFLNFFLNYCPAKLISWPDMCKMYVYHISRAWDDLPSHQKVYPKPLCAAALKSQLAVDWHLNFEDSKL